MMFLGYKSIFDVGERRLKAIGLMLIKVNTFRRTRAYFLYLGREQAPDIHNADGADDRCDRAVPGILAEKELYGGEQGADPAYPAAVPGDPI